MIRALMAMLMLVLCSQAGAAQVNMQSVAAQIQPYAVTESGVVDEISINGRKFDTLNQRTLIFYPEDLEDGKVVVRGLLEREDGGANLDGLFVEITTDGGEQWSRARGQGEWEWSFQPQFGRSYEFSIRVVKAIAGEPAIPVNLPTSLRIAGFTLSLGNDARLVDGRLSGAGTLSIPYFEQFRLPQVQRVEFSGLEFANGSVTAGTVVAPAAFTLPTQVGDIFISRLSISAVPEQSRIEGRIAFKGLLTTLPALALDEGSRLLVNGFHAQVGVGSHTLDIFPARGVRLALSAGRVGIDYTLGDRAPRLDLSGTGARVQFGSLLTDASHARDSFSAMLVSSAAGVHRLQSAGAAYLLDSAIKFENLVLNLDLADPARPAISFQSGVDLSGYDHAILKRLSGGVVSATITRDGLTAGFSGTGAPITLLDRGGAGKNVQLRFVAAPAFTLMLSGQDAAPRFDLGEISAKLDFGTLLTKVEAAGQSAAVEADLAFNSAADAVLTFPGTARAYLPGRRVALEGMTARFNPQTLALAVAASADLESSDNPIFRALNGAAIRLAISPSGVTAGITADGGIEPVVLLSRGGGGKDVTLEIAGTPSVTLTVVGETVDLAFGPLQASLGFGDILQSARGALSPVVARLENAAGNALALSFPNAAGVYLLGSPFAIEGLSADFDLANKSIHFSGGANLSAYADPLIRALSGSRLSADITPSGLTATLNVSGNLPPVTVLNRGGGAHDVRLEFTTPPQVRLAVRGGELDFSFSGGSAQLSFGDLLEGATARLDALTDAANQAVAGMYRWQVEGRKRLVSDARLYLSGLGGSLDLSRPTAPRIGFAARADLSGYGGMLASLGDVALRDGVISPQGVSGTVAFAPGNLPIWPQRNVRFELTGNPELRFALSGGGLVMGVAGLAGRLNFGDLLDGAVAEVESTYRENVDVEAGVQEITALAAAPLTWTIDGARRLAGSRVTLQNLSGALNLGDLSAPSIRLDAVADLSQYGQAFETVRAAALENATISGQGFTGTLSTTLSRIDIWKDKNVGIALKAPARLNLSVTAAGLGLGVEGLDGMIEFGDLLKGAKARLSAIDTSRFAWSLDKSFALDGQNLSLHNLAGSLDLRDLADPRVSLNALLDLKNYGSLFSRLAPVAIEAATLSRRGFSASAAIPLGAIDIWPAKRVQAEFTAPPRMNLSVTSGGVKIGLSDVAANLKFGDLLGGLAVALTPLGTQVTEGVANAGLYRWVVPDPASARALITDAAGGAVTVAGMNGTLKLADIANPMVTFDATANFNNFDPGLGFALNQQIALDDTRISRNGIAWNLNIQGSGTVTILDLGVSADDVRLELAGSAAVGNSGASAAGSGKLFFGALFAGNKSVTLTKDGDDYTFSLAEVLEYSKQGHGISLSGLSGRVSKLADGNYKVTLAGDATVHSTLLARIGVGSISFTELAIDAGGFKGVINATWSAKDISILNGKARVILSGASIAIDSSRDIPITLNGLNGKLDLGALFDAGQTALADLRMEAGRVVWGFADKTLKLKEKYLFRNLGGSLDLEGEIPAIALSGNFGYDGLDDLALALQGFKVDAGGLSGTLALATGSIQVGGIPGFKLDALSASFGQTISGSVGFKYTKAQFLGSSQKLDIGFTAGLSENGIGDLAISGTLPELNIEKFARLGFTRVAASPNWRDFSMTLDGRVQPANSLFSASNSIEFQGLRISKDGISIAGAGTEFDVSGANASLGGFGLSLKKLGIGFIDQVFYVSAKGDLDLQIASAGAGLKLKSNGDVVVDSISILVNQPAVRFAGEVLWYKDDSVYGNGFGATGLSLRIADMFGVTGAFKVGKKSSRYWMANAQGGIGAGIPFGPLTIYEMGGGAAYNMRYDTSSKVFVPANSDNVVIILSSLLGTSDNGYTWHGQLDLNLDSGGQITAIGDSYILSQKNESPGKRHISGTITIAPASLHITADAHIEYLFATLAGRADILFEPGKKHVYIGTGPQAAEHGFVMDTELGPVSVSAFGLDATGYFMIDTRQLAFGARYTFKKKVSLDWVGPNPWARLHATAGADGLLRYQPFYMDLGADALVNLAVGYGDVWDAELGLSLDLRFVAPDPTYARVKLGFYIPDPYDGWVHFTTYFPSKPASSTSESLPGLISQIEPYAESDVSLMPALNVVTAFKSNGTPVAIDNGSDRYTLSVTGVSLLDQTSNLSVALNETPGGEYEMHYLPQQALIPGHRYKLAGEARLIGGNTQVKSEPFDKEFTTTTTNALRFDEVVDRVTPINNQPGVMEGAPITLHYKDVVKVLGVTHPLVRNFTVKLVSAKNEPIQGRVTTSSGDNPKMVLTPDERMRAYDFCVRNATGEIRETFRNQRGEYLNPFKGYVVDGAAGTAASPVPSGIGSGNLPADIQLGSYSSTSSGASALDTYSYYTNDRYNIIVTDESSKTPVYVSSFRVATSRSADENLTLFDVRKDQLVPTFTLTTDTTNAQRAYIRVVSDLDRIDVVAGVGVGWRVISNWTTQSGDVTLTGTHDNYSLANYSSVRDPGVTIDFNSPLASLNGAVVIEYFDMQNQQILLTRREMVLLNGQPWDPTSEPRRWQGAADRARQTNGEGAGGGLLSGGNDGPGIVDMGSGMGGPGGLGGLGGGGYSGGGGAQFQQGGTR